MLLYHYIYHHKTWKRETSLQIVYSNSLVSTAALMKRKIPHDKICCSHRVHSGGEVDSGTHWCCQQEMQQDRRQPSRSVSTNLHEDILLRYAWQETVFLLRLIGSGNSQHYEWFGCEISCRNSMVVMANKGHTVHGVNFSVYHLPYLYRNQWSVLLCYEQ